MSRLLQRDLKNRYENSKIVAVWPSLCKIFYANAALDPWISKEEIHLSGTLGRLGVLLTCPRVSPYLYAMFAAVFIPRSFEKFGSMIPRRIPVFLLASGLVLLIVSCASLACARLLSALGDVAGAAGMDRAVIAAGALLAADLVGLVLILGYLMLEHGETFGDRLDPDGIESPE